MHRICKQGANIFDVRSFLIQVTWHDNVCLINVYIISMTMMMIIITAFITRVWTALSSIFIARHYEIKRSLLSAGVRPSVTFVYCIQTAEDIVNFFLGPAAQ